MTRKRKRRMPTNLVRVYVSSHLDYPFQEIVESALREIGKGHWIQQKFTCAQCHTRLTMTDVNMLHTHGTCDRCGHVTNITQTGCNFRRISVEGGSLQDLAALGVIDGPKKSGLTINRTPPESLHQGTETKQ